MAFYKERIKKSLVTHGMIFYATKKQSMSTETWTAYIWSMLGWGSDESLSVTPTPSAAQLLIVNQEELLGAKMALRPSQTRVAPSKYPSRIPHIEEMNQLARKYRQEQRKLRAVEKNNNVQPS